MSRLSPWTSSRSTMPVSRNSSFSSTRRDATFHARTVAHNRPENSRPRLLQLCAYPSRDVLHGRSSLRIDLAMRRHPRIPLRPQPAVHVGIGHSASPKNESLGLQGVQDGPARHLDIVEGWYRLPVRAGQAATFELRTWIQPLTKSFWFRVNEDPFAFTQIPTFVAPAAAVAMPATA